jgi:uncharacterized protein (TIGR02231 family)
MEKNVASGLLPLVLGLCLAACAAGPAAKAPKTDAAAEGAPEPRVFGLAAELAGADADDGSAVKSRITRVTVYADRALVTRQASVPLTAEAVVHRFRQLPGWVDEGSVRAATSGGTILDVSVERQFLARSTDAGFRKAEQQHRAMLRRMRALEDELAILDAQEKHVASIQAFSIEKLSTDAPMRDIKVSTYGEVVDFVSDRRRTTAEARRESEAKREDLAPEVAASERKLEEIRRLTKLEQTTVLVTLKGNAGGNAELTLTYATPGATWEPTHELRASAAHPEAVALTSFAVVTQTTGEDWRHAKLSFSTQSSSDAEQIPELEMLVLGKPFEVSSSVTRTTSFSRAQQKYVEQNRDWNQLNQMPSHVQADIRHFEQSYASNLEYFERVQTKTVELFQGLQKRGTTAHFDAVEPAIVRSDGRSVRLPIGGKTIAASSKIIAAPEQSLNAALTLELKNPDDQALLPGRVARYYEGAFLGVTDIDFVAPGEGLSVFFRVADQVKLTRKLDRKQSSLSRKTSNRMQLSFLSTVENLSQRPVTLVLAERVPVSENSEIRVSRIEITPTAKPDAEGIARWTITLLPGEQRELRVSYQVDYPPSLIFDVKRRKELAPPRSPASPAANPYDGGIEERIIQYEEMF